MFTRYIKVWVQAFKGLPHFRLQWHDPVTGKRKTRTTGTSDRERAEQERAELEYKLNHKRLSRAQGSMPWKVFRAAFEDEYLTGRPEGEVRDYLLTLHLFEVLCRPGALGGICPRTVERFAQKLDKGGTTGAPGALSTASKLSLLHGALDWAAKRRWLRDVPSFPSGPASADAPPAGASSRKDRDAPEEQHIRRFPGGVQVEGGPPRTAGVIAEADTWVIEPLPDRAPHPLTVQAPSVVLPGE